MPTLTISGIAHVYADPSDTEPLADREALEFLHGMHSDDECSDYVELDSDLEISAGRLRLVFEPATNSLRITTAYDVSRRPTDAEIESLLDETMGQWSDGMGNGHFASFKGEVLSRSLALAILNADPSNNDLGSLFVDVYPPVEDQEVRVEWKEEGAADDDLISDLREAAESGDAEAQFELARRFEQGMGVAEDPDEAFRLFQQSSNAGNVAATTFLGLCYEEGKGCPQDVGQAVDLFQQAAEQDYALAMHCLGDCYMEGRGLEVNPEQAIAWYKRGAEQGDPGCLAELGDCLEFGKGIESDLQTALECYQEALEYGFDAVEEAIERVENQLRDASGS